MVLLALLCSLHGVGTSTSNTTIVAPEGSYAFPDKTLAVFIAGTRMRFLLQSFVRRVVAPCAGEGFGVHVYLSLLGFKDGSLQADYEGFDIIPDPETSGYSPEGLRNYVGNAIANAGPPPPPSGPGFVVLVVLLCLTSCALCRSPLESTRAPRANISPNLPLVPPLL